MCYPSDTYFFAPMMNLDTQTHSSSEFAVDKLSFCLPSDSFTNSIALLEMFYNHVLTIYLADFHLKSSGLFAATRKIINLCHPRGTAPPPSDHGMESTLADDDGQSYMRPPQS